MNIVRDILPDIFRDFLTSAIVLIAALSLPCPAQPPYSGTIFLDPYIITSADPSALQSVTYIGRGQRIVFDRRQATWIAINAYLFAIEWNDRLRSEAQINPEFGSVEAATTEEQHYARLIGQLPYCLRIHVRAIWIHQGVQPFGGGNNSILIHTGQAALYQRDGIVEETLIHEAAHTSLDSMYATALGWRNAQRLDGNFISQYAAQNPDREDVAESFLPWFALRYRRTRISDNAATAIARTIPNRLAFFDKQNFDLRPLVTRTSLLHTSIISGVELFPNPASETLRISIKQGMKRQFENAVVQIFAMDGSLVAEEHLDEHPTVEADNSHSIDIRYLARGSYMLVLTTPQGQQYKFLWIKTAT